MNISVLTIGTVLIIVISWFISIRDRRYHGISRFFSFESVFILALLNLRIWFVNPFSILQIISWILLTLSAYTVIAGYLLLSRKGNPDGNPENTSILVKSGIYKYVRHPLYLSLFLLGTGVMLKNPEKVQIALGIVNLIALWITARIEENEMIAKFGDEYREYMKDSKMFIPFLV